MRMIMKKTCSYLSMTMNLMICLLLVFNPAIFHIDIKRYSSFVEYNATTYVSYNKKEVLEEVSNTIMNHIIMLTNEKK